MTRQQRILAGVLVFQLVLSVLVFWPRQGGSAAAEPVFPDLKPEDVVSLTITDDQGKSLTLARKGDGWVLPAADDFPVKETTVTSILEKLTRLNRVTLVTRTADSHKQLKVAEDVFMRRLDFKTADGTSHTVFLGTAPRYTATHFRVDGETETYQTTELATWELNTQPNNWIDTTYVDLDAAQLEKVTLENAQGTFVLVRDGDTWTLADLGEGEEIAPGKTNALVRNATSLTVLEPLGKTEQVSYGLAEPKAVVTLEMQDGTVHTLTVGAESAEGDSYVVKYSDSPYYVRVASYAVKAMVENGHQDFLREPPTPVPTPTSAP